MEKDGFGQEKKLREKITFKEMVMFCQPPFLQKGIYNSLE